MVAIVLITHPAIGQALLTTAQKTLKEFPCEVRAIDIQQDTNVDQAFADCIQQITPLAKQNDVLLLSDIFGATPHNIAQRVANHFSNSHLISGVNLPMLLRALNYAHLPLAELCEKALDGGAHGIHDCTHS